MPRSLPLERRVRANGISLAIFEWGRNLAARGDTILLAHATGFHARCWDQVVRRLGERHVIAVDQRGHGRSDKVFPVRWQDFGRDLAELIAALDLERVIGVGHSMGGHAITEAAAAEPGRFRRLVLIDPVIAAPAMYEAADLIAARFGLEPHPTAKRKNHWTSPDEMFERFHDRPPFSTFERAVLRDYCKFGMLPAANGRGFVLACPPEFEAAVYMASASNGGVYDSVRTVDVPVKVLRAMEPPPDRSPMDFRYSPTWPGLAAEFKHGRELYLPDRTHFLPMEDTAFVARHILAEE